MNFRKHLFKTVSFIRTMPYTSFQRSQTLKRRVIELIIQIQRNFWVPYTVHFICLFRLMFCCINLFPLHFCQAVLLWKKSTWKISGQYSPPKFFNIASYFSEIWSHFPPQIIYLMVNGFLHFPDVLSALENARDVLGTAEVQAFQMSSLSSGTWSLLHNFIVSKKSKFYFELQIFAISSSDSD